jgi:hypothetical protein
VQRFLSIDVAQGRAQLLDIGCKSRFTTPSDPPSIPGPPYLEKRSPNYDILRPLSISNT